MSSLAVTKSPELDFQERGKDSVSVLGLRVFLCCFALTLAIAVPWFLSVPLHLDTFAGDDLSLWQAQKAGTASSNVHQALTEAVAEKYRPVASLLYLITFRVFGGNFRLYVLFNLFLFCFVAAFFGSVISMESGFKYAPALIFSALFTMSRCAYYNVLQRLGIMETAALFLCLITIGLGLYFYRSGKLRDAVAALIAFFLCIHTHEQYVVLALFLSLTFFFAFRAPKRLRWTLLPFPGLIVLMNILEKKFWLHTHFMTGTGGTYIKLDFISIWRFMQSGLLTVMGFNRGPAYLSICDFRDLGLKGYIPGMIMSSASLIITGIYLARKDRKSAATEAILFLALFSSLLLSASMTFRQEFRWLLAPDVVFIAVISLMAGNLYHRGFARHLVWVAMGLFLCGSVWADVIIRQRVINLYFMGGLSDAESVRSVIVDGFKNQLGRRAIYAIDGNFDPAIIAAYSGIKNTSIIPISSRDVDALSSKDIENGLFFVKHGAGWENVHIPIRKTSQKIGEASDTDIEIMPGLREALQKSPGNWYWTMKVGEMFVGHDPAKAEHYLRESIRMVGQGNPYPYFDLGQLFQSEGHLKRAEKYYKLAVQYDDKLHPNPGLKNAVDAMKKILRDAK